MKIINMSFIGLFMSALILPLAFVNLPGGAVSRQENRVLAARPAMSYAFQAPRDFIKKFEAWFADNVGFRENMITLYKRIDKIETEGHQYREGQYIIIIGQQGHRYFADVDGWMISKFQGKPFISDDQIQGMANRLKEIKHYLDGRNIPLIVMFCTDKESIYPEYYPKTIKRGPEPIQLDIITEYLKNNTDIDIFNIREQLMAEKGKYQLYNREVGDLTHYNEIGAFFAYQELMEHINVYFPEMKTFTLSDINISYDENNIPTVALKQDLRYKKLEPGFFDDVPLNDPSQREAFENDDPYLPTILFMRDSYTGSGNFISQYIPQHFGTTILIHFANMKYFEEYIDRFNPDIVIFESAERALRGFVDSLIYSK